MYLKHTIIPEKPVLVNLAGKERRINFEAIAAFAAFGFFLDDDTFWVNQKMLAPGTMYSLNEKNELLYEKQYFEWYKSPKHISFSNAVEEFTYLFESCLIERKDKDHRLIVPLSGGLDSRTIAASLQDNPNVHAYSYQFEGGIPECSFGRQIAHEAGFTFEEFRIPSGYLWRSMDALANINQCHAEFTHPRQMYIFDQLRDMGDMLIGGHGGDLFFDSMGIDSCLSFDEQVMILEKKLIRMGGLELGSKLWDAWGLEGSFSEYIRSRIEYMLRTIPIDDANARLRAFKSKYYVSRWTMVNMQIFSSRIPVFLPYFTDEMCKFICDTPEEHLTGRRIQIEYIKRKSPILARIPWQEHRPFNLYNYHWDKSPWNLPFRAWDKAKRTWNKLNGESLIQRNWELQFLGAENDRELREWLFNNRAFTQFVPQDLVRYIYQKFSDVDAVRYSHPLSMLLTLSMFAYKNPEGNPNA